jgi:hypothetical protein
MLSLIPDWLKPFPSVKAVCFLWYVTYNPSLSDIYGEGYKPTLKVAHSGRNYQGSLLVNVTLGWKLGNYDIHAKHKIDFVHKRDKMVWNLAETKRLSSKNLLKFTAKFC